MKELVSALSQATANRLKAPILGSFILAWLVWNYIYVLEFLFSESKDKITFVKSLEFHFWSDLLIPAIVAVVYTFGLPWLQHKIDKIKHDFIDDERIRAKHNRDKSKYESLSGAAKAQAESSLEYQKDKLGRDLDKWEEQRSSLGEKIAKLSEEIVHQTQLRQEAEIKTSNTQSQLDSSVEAQQVQGEQIKSLKADLVNLQNNANSLEKHYMELKTQTRDHRGILDLIANLDIDETEALRDHYLDNSNFRALAHARDINNPEYINELLNHDHVINAVLENLTNRNDIKLRNILAGAGYVYSDMKTFADAFTELPLDNKYDQNEQGKDLLTPIKNQ